MTERLVTGGKAGRRGGMNAEHEGNDDPDCGADAQPPVRILGDRRRPKGFYVYAHLREDGTPFYVGKGVGNRAWSTNRDACWWHFVRTRCGNSYEVAILAEELEEEAALGLEAQLIERYGEVLTNWVNPGRGFDYEAIARFHRLRAETRGFIDDTRSLEGIDPDLAISRYREAIQRMYGYCGIEMERGLVAELRKEMGEPQYGDIDGLDRLTVLLMKLKRFEEVVEAVDDYARRFQTPWKSNHRIVKRYAKASAALKE